MSTRHQLFSQQLVPMMHRCGSGADSTQSGVRAHGFGGSRRAADHAFAKTKTHEKRHSQTGALNALHAPEFADCPDSGISRQSPLVGLMLRPT
jgi:hypothetical protein